MNPRDLPEMVVELTIKMHEVPLKLNAINGRVDRLTRTAEEGVRLMREENRQNTDRLIQSFNKSMAPLIDRVLAREAA